MAVNDVWNVVRLGRGWWFEVFRQPRIYEAVEWAIDTVIGNSSRDFACLAWTPTAAPILEALQPARLVFDSLDNWLIHPVLRRHERQARAAYSAIFARADVILASGAASAAAFAPFGVPISIVANGVDIDRFGAALERPADMPPGLIVGYAGKLAGRIDVDFCRAVAGLLPDVQFVFLGPVMDLHVRTLAKIPNVHLLGDRRPEVLPAYLESFDIGWIPHRVGEGETGGDPIKLYEYWAAGRQVVTTAIDGSDGWRDRAFVVADAAEAASSIRLILSGDAMKEVWVDPDRLWSTIAERLAAALVSENESFAPSATGVPNAGDLRFNAPPSSPAPS
ncbi:MAG TPA: glycosyltransferase [Candidatus Limnocylindrales bacterium]|nr:glycosyltransferase [Candidatus Limnocylindrales bacterium]